MLQQSLLSRQIVSEFRRPFLSAVLLGKQPLVTSDDRPAREMAIAMGANPRRICIIDAPSGPSGKGHKTVQDARFAEPIAADGALFQVRGAAAVIQTADNPTLVLYDEATHKVVLVQSGRAGLTQDGGCATCHFTVISAAMMRLTLGGSARTVRAAIMGSICSRCFASNEPNGEAYDTVAVIRHELIHKGVLPQHIHHDGLCTKENPLLSSRGDDTKNTIIVVRH